MWHCTAESGGNLPQLPTTPGSFLCVALSSPQPTWLHTFCGSFTQQLSNCGMSRVRPYACMSMSIYVLNAQPSAWPWPCCRHRIVTLPKSIMVANRDLHRGRTRWSASIGVSFVLSVLVFTADHGEKRESFQAEQRWYLAGVCDFLEK